MTTVYKIPRSVLVVIHTPDLQVLMMERAGWQGFWQSVTGSLARESEPLRDTAVREVREETGLDVTPLRLIGVYSAPANGQVVTYPDGNVIHYVSSNFECRVVGGALACNDESLELGWFDPERLPAEMVPMHRVRVADALAHRPEAFVR